METKKPNMQNLPGTREEDDLVGPNTPDPKFDAKVKQWVEKNKNNPAPKKSNALGQATIDALKKLSEFAGVLVIVLWRNIVRL